MTETIPKEIMGTIIKKILKYSGSNDTANFFRYDIYKYQITRYGQETKRFSDKVHKIFDVQDPNWYKNNMIDKLEHPDITKHDKEDHEEYLLNSFIGGKELTNLLHGMDGRSSKGRKTKRKREILEAQRKYKEVKSVIDSTQLPGLKLTITDSEGNDPKTLTGGDLMLYNHNLLGRIQAIKGGIESSKGFQFEEYFMNVVCRLLSIPLDTYEAQTELEKETFGVTKNGKIKKHRQVDFFIKTPKSDMQKFEITLTGAGNPESQDKSAREMDVMVLGATTDNARSNLKKQCSLIVLEDGNVLEQFTKYFESVGFKPKKANTSLAEIYQKVGLT